jgi:hypothetical protein
MSRKAEEAASSRKRKGASLPERETSKRRAGPSRRLPESEEDSPDEEVEFKVYTHPVIASQLIEQSNSARYAPSVGVNASWTQLVHVRRAGLAS